MKTLGEKRVRTDFNVSEDSFVYELKMRTAELINLCEAAKRDSNKNPEDSGEINRLLALAQTDYESAAQWAVKAATAGK